MVEVAGLYDWGTATIGMEKTEYVNFFLFEHLLHFASWICFFVCFFANHHPVTSGLLLY